mmetsp:Transcript_17102/g.46248  ORF Transcript_17102/g.46248 Transcript_17102/m.46248 type:complete len:445 (+) Transcript_17102:1116-2450(+)
MRVRAGLAGGHGGAQRVRERAQHEQGLRAQRCRPCGLGLEVALRLPLRHGGEESGALGRELAHDGAGEGVPCARARAHAQHLLERLCEAHAAKESPRHTLVARRRGRARCALACRLYLLRCGGAEGAEGHGAQARTQHERHERAGPAHALHPVAVHAERGPLLAPIHACCSCPSRSLSDLSQHFRGAREGAQAGPVARGAGEGDHVRSSAHGLGLVGEEVEEQVGHERTPHPLLHRPDLAGRCGKDECTHGHRLGQALVAGAVGLHARPGHEGHDGVQCAVLEEGAVAAGGARAQLLDELEAQVDLGPHILQGFIPQGEELTAAREEGGGAQGRALGGGECLCLGARLGEDLGEVLDRVLAHGLGQGRKGTRGSPAGEELCTRRVEDVHGHGAPGVYELPHVPAPHGHLAPGHAELVRRVLLRRAAAAVSPQRGGNCWQRELVP